jgi:hypothetical protein
MQYKLTKFYMGFRLIVVSLDKNMYARVGSQLKYFEPCPRSRGPATPRRWAAYDRIDCRILYRQNRSIPCRLLKSDYTKYALSIDSNLAS